MANNAIVFYNGFNLLLDIVFCYIAYRIGKAIGRADTLAECDCEEI